MDFTAIDFTGLNNPIWNALSSVHRSLARTNGFAARYANDVSPLTGLAEYTPRAFADLANLVGPGERVVLFTTFKFDVPADWKVQITRWIDQMVCAQPPPAIDAELVPLSRGDVPEMLDLTAATKPGPFSTNTIAMGEYFGIRQGDRLASMAGERLKLDAFTESSAVCTNPDFRGRGLSKALLSFIARRIFEQNKTPFLHVKTENEDAKRVYEKLGFKVRCPIWLTVIARNKN